MRKSSKNTVINPSISSVQCYHQGGYHGNYAYQGFKSNKFFTSDRFIKLDENFNRCDGKPLKGYGLEIESECRGIRNQTVYAEVLNKIIFAEFPDDLFKLQNDSTLEGDTNAEIITQVMTREFIRNQYPAFKAMYNVYFPAFNVSCSASGNCGMHVNMSNALFGAKEESQVTAIRKFLYIVNKHYALFCALTNRSISNTNWCRQMPTYATKEGAKNADMYRMPSSHGNCFNASHFPEGRIELRIVGGQKDFACFRNTMESIFHVVEAVKKLSWDDCDDLAKIFSGCNQYVFDRLNTKCRNAGTISLAKLQEILPTVKTEQLI